jgi:hypothetical protein
MQWAGRILCLEFRARDGRFLELFLDQNRLLAAGFSFRWEFYIPTALRLPRG